MGRGINMPRLKERFIKPESLKKFIKSVLIKLEIPKDHTDIIADSLIFASIRGIDSHGIVRLPYYIERLKQKGTKSNPKIKIVSDYRGTALIDGDNGMGQIIGIFASDLAIKKAIEFGIAMVNVKNSSHFGAASFYSNYIAKHHLIGLTVSNTTPVMAAWGGAGKIIGNNPLSIALPYKGSNPIVLDIAMSKVAGGKVRYYAKNKQNIPKGWIVDYQGKDTTNPDDLPQGGSLIPFGEHKGFALAIILELLSGDLSGGGILSQVNSWLKKPDTPTNMSQIYIAVDIKKIIDFDLFLRQIDLLIKEIKCSKVAPGFQKIYIPGEIESEVERIRKKQGIPLTSEILSDLQKLSNTYQVKLPELN